MVAEINEQLMGLNERIEMLTDVYALQKIVYYTLAVSHT